MDVAPQVSALLRAGCKLVPIPLGKKGPTLFGWNKPAGAIAGEENARRFAGKNAGLAHAWSRTCAIDVDAFDAADAWLGERGVDLPGLLVAPDAVQVKSPKPNRAKLLYRLPDGVDPLLTHQVADAAGTTILEFRCAAQGGVTVQDVVAGRHPEGGEYALRGDAARMPTLPAALLTLWRSLIREPRAVNGNGHAPAQPLVVLPNTLRDLRSALGAIPSDNRDTWVSMAHALKVLGDAGRGLWMEWSQTSEKFDAADAGRVWSSANPVATSYPAVFAEARRHGWQNPRAAGADGSPGRAARARAVGGSADFAAAPEADSARRRLRALTVDELMQTPAPAWLVRGVLPQRSIALVWGASQSGKTFAVLDLAIAVARGERWNDRRTNAGGVVYVAGEGHLKHRMAAAMQHRQLGAADFARFRVVASSVNLLDPVADLEPLLAELRAARETLGGVALVVLDTLNAMMPGGDENASDDMGRMIAAAREIATATEGTVLYVHHCGKEEVRGARGHSSLRAAVDTELVVRDAETHRTLTVEKQRDGEAGEVFAFKLRPVDLGPSEDPAAEPDERDSSCVVEPLDATMTPVPTPRRTKRDIALEALQDALSEYGEPVPGTSTIPPGTKATTLDRWRARYRLKSGDDYQTDRVADSAFRRERHKLLAEGKVACSGTYVWRL